MGNPGYHNIPQAIVVTIVAAASIIKHRTNIQRLLAGNENKIY
jgi:glycerol-3-phosphate acyltransferase PlsY